VRKICNACRETYSPAPWEKKYLKDDTVTELQRGRGCELCNGSGYFGRTLVYELLSVDRDIAKLIDREADLSLIAEKANERGFVSIFDTTVAKVKQGVTTTEEAVRVLGHIRQV